MMSAFLNIDWEYNLEIFSFKLHKNSQAAHFFYTSFTEFNVTRLMTLVYYVLYQLIYLEMNTREALSFAVFEIGSHQNVHHGACLGPSMVQLAVTTLQQLKEKIVAF